LLIARIAKLELTDEPFEVIIVDDDSQDGTAEITAELQSAHAWLKFIVRKSDRSWSKSIIEGIRNAQFPILIFMDADLSHPPEAILEMLNIIRTTDTEMVIGSRYMHGGSIDKKWPFYRNLISHLSTWIIKPLLPVPIKDPLSGFIALRKNKEIKNQLFWNPIGTKLGLEIIVKSHLKKIVEIPIYFGQRQFGESKLLSLKIATHFASQVIQLWLYKLFGERVLS
jgi:dolichol-phosphate mannosyltransferase